MRRIVKSSVLEICLEFKSNFFLEFAFDLFECLLHRHDYVTNFVFIFQQIDLLENFEITKRMRINLADYSVAAFVHLLRNPISVSLIQ